MRNPTEWGGISAGSSTSHTTRLVSVCSTIIIALLLTPVASAHGATGDGVLSQWSGLAIAAVGIIVVFGAISAKHTRRISPTSALYGIFAGICVIAIGAVIFEGLSPDPVYSGQSMPFPRSWYLPLGLFIGLAIAIGSFVLVLLRWPKRPRYAFFGLLMALWISYPYLVPGMASDTHPLGYGIVLGTPIAVGYIVWKDIGDVILDVLRDPVARRFGVGVALVLAFFFLAMTGYLSFFPDPDVPDGSAIVVLPVLFQLVIWPTLELAFPNIPFFAAISPGQVVVVGTLSALIGLNAAVIARYWRLQVAAGKTQGTAGTVSILGTCTCGCCGPLVAKVTILAAGPSIAAPLYWIFVDSASPLSALFIVVSLSLFTATLVYSVGVHGGDEAESKPTLSEQPAL
jgi:hypothetical protein